MIFLRMKEMLIYLRYLPPNKVRCYGNEHEEMIRLFKQKYVVLPTDKLSQYIKEYN